MLMGLGLFIFTQKSLGPIGLAPDEEVIKKKGVLYHVLTLLFIPVFFVLVNYQFDLKITENIVLKFTDLIFLVAAVFTISYIVIQIRKSTPEEGKKLTVASILILFSAVFWSFFEQGGGSLNFFANGNVQSHGLNMTQVNNSVNSAWVVVIAPIIGAFWLFLNKRKQEPDTINKFGFGFIFLGIGFLVFFASKFLADANGLSPLWTFFFAYFVITLGELCLSPIGLSMVTTLSPKRLHGVMMGTWFLASAYGQYGAGLIGAALSSSDEISNPTNYQKLEIYTSGYETIGYISIVAGVLLIAFSGKLRNLMK
jgi:POT family proton-dependent oligopeptide transporter